MNNNVIITITHAKIMRKRENGTRLGREISNQPCFLTYIKKA